MYLFMLCFSIGLGGHQSGRHVCSAQKIEYLSGERENTTMVHSIA